MGSAVLLNGAISLVPQGIVPSPFAVMVEDARFVLERADLLRRLPAGTPLCLVGPALQALGEVDPGLYSHFRLYFMQGFDSHYGEPKRTLGEADAPYYRTDGRLCLSLDLGIGHFGCGTVMYSGVQMAFHARARQLCLVGFDWPIHPSDRYEFLPDRHAYSSIQSRKRCVGLFSGRNCNERYVDWAM